MVVGALVSSDASVVACAITFASCRFLFLAAASRARQSSQVLYCLNPASVTGTILWQVEWGHSRGGSIWAEVTHVSKSRDFFWISDGRDLGQPKSV